MKTVDMRRLRKDLSGSDKLPMDFCGTFKDFKCFDFRKESLGLFDVTVKKGTGNSSLHRVFISCPICKTLIPAGRIAQHVKRKDHIDPVQLIVHCTNGESFERIISESECVDILTNGRGMNIGFVACISRESVIHRGQFVNKRYYQMTKVGMQEI